MIPRINCSSCGHELSPRDKFCGNCGEKVEMEGKSSGAVTASVIKCNLCGSENPAESRYCEVCGAILSGTFSSDRIAKGRQEHQKKPEERKASVRGGVHPGAAKGLAGWKVVALVGGILLIGLIIIGVKRNQVVSLPSKTPAQSTVSPTLLQEIDEMRKVVDADPKNASTILKLANLLHDGKFIDQAIVHYKKYLALNEKDPDARVDLGICYYESGDPKTAIAEMEKALSFNPKHQLAHFNLGIVSLGSGDVEKAVSWFKKCIALAPETETARRAQELINQHSVGSNFKIN